MRCRHLLFLVAAIGCGDDNPYQTTASAVTELTQYESCADLERDLKDMLIAEAETNIKLSVVRGVGFPGLPEIDAVADEADSSAPTREEGKDFSGTNNQVAGVDEADFVKTDGFHIFLINGNRLHIMGVPEFGALDPITETELEGTPQEMLYDAESKRMVVFSQINAYSLPEEHPIRALVGANDDELNWYWRVSLLSKLTVLDLSDPKKPALIRELFMEGWYQTARLVDATVRMGTYALIELPPSVYRAMWSFEMSDAERSLSIRDAINKLSLSDLTPFLYERLADGKIVEHVLSQSSCRAFSRPSNSQARGITSLYSLDVMRAEMEFDADHIVTNSPTIYASSESLYVAEPANDWWWFWWNEDHVDQLNIHKFDTRSAGKSQYVGSGRVKGRLHNQFSLDEYEGKLRVATTQNWWNRWWEEDPPAATNHVFVLEHKQNRLEEIGHVGDIAKNERIFAARFVGDRGYLVTFEQVDPLFTLDLSNPEEPRVEGELHIFGFSTYIHPIADDQLLTIGVGGDENGANWRTQVSMFDVSKPEDPTLADVEELVQDGEWGWSEAMYEHKAFQYWAPEQLLAIPLSASRSWAVADGWHWEQTSTLQLIRVSTTEGLSHYGEIDHSYLFNREEEQYWYNPAIRRSIFMGNYIYAISDKGITVHDVDSLDKVDEEPLPGIVPNYYHWWW